MPKPKVSKAFKDKRKNSGNSRTFAQKQAAKKRKKK